MLITDSSGLGRWHQGTLSRTCPGATLGRQDHWRVCSWLVTAQGLSSKDLHTVLGRAGGGGLSPPAQPGERSPRRGQLPPGVAHLPRPVGHSSHISVNPGSSSPADRCHCSLSTVGAARHKETHVRMERASAWPRPTPQAPLQGSGGQERTHCKARAAERWARGVWALVPGGNGSGNHGRSDTARYIAMLSRMFSRLKWRIGAAAG